jgi:hypothetical protein
MQIMAQIVGTSGDDNLTGVKGEANTIWGDTNGTADPSTILGNDTLTGGANSPDNTIYGDAQILQGKGTTGGNDTLVGGAHSINTLVGDSDSTFGAPTGGNDTLIGGTGGTNYLIGDFVTPGGQDTGGADRLVSADRTTDYMWGDFQNVGGGNTLGGADTFVFDTRNGQDVIYDFSSAQGDIIEISSGKGGHAVTSISDLNIQLVDTNGDNVPDSSQIVFDSHDTVTVMNDTTLTASDFHFVA